MARCTAAKSLDTICLLEDLENRGAVVVAHGVWPDAEDQSRRLPTLARFSELHDLELLVGAHLPSDHEDGLVIESSDHVTPPAMSREAAREMVRKPVPKLVNEPTFRHFWHWHIMVLPARAEK